MTLGVHVAEDLSAVLRAHQLSQAPSEIDLHSRDESAHDPRAPDAVVWPESTEQVSAVLAVCHRHRVPVTAFGIGSSLEGHVLPVRGGVSLDLSRMDRILAINDADLDCRVQAGVHRETLDARLGERGLLFGVDPGADATLGGMAATGASGTMTVRYGTMRENVLALEAVLADGTVLHTGSRARKSSAGYDLTRLLIGSEGTLAVITELQLRVHGIPERIAAARCSFPTVRQVVDAVTDLLRIGLPVARCELLDALAMQSVNEHSGLAEAETPTLFLELHGSAAGVDVEMQTLAEVVGEHGGSDLRWAATTQERAALWHARHNALFAARALRPGARPYSTDVCVPISALADVIAATSERVQELPFPAPILGHVGDGNFHCVLLVREEDPAERVLVARFLEDLVGLALAAGGTCTGEHGVGLGKREALRREAGDAAIEVMRQLKATLDPLGLLNPGKVIPEPLDGDQVAAATPLAV
jgi:D-lactate dehydrogenase (cytochrome)